MAADLNFVVDQNSAGIAHEGDVLEIGELRASIDFGKAAEGEGRNW